MIPSSSTTHILTNGRFYTLDVRQPRATAVAISDDRILAVGTDDEIAQHEQAGAQVINLNGRTVIPGLVDAHVHFEGFALSLQRVNLDATATRAEAIARVAAFTASQPASDGWLLGRGWAQGAWEDQRFPTAADLDAVVPDRPVLLRDKSGHAAWVNTPALRLAGIGPHTVDPAGGQIQRSDDGDPTGILFETAIGLVSDHVPPPTADDVATAMVAAQEYCWRAGLTGIHDFDGRRCFQALQLLHERGELGLRVVKNIPVARLEHALGVGLRSGFGDDWLRIGGIKIFADGALGPRTAAMITPYEGEPDNRGIVVTDKEEMLENGRRASAGGLSVTVHAIGDRANHDILDVFEYIRREERDNGRPLLRHRIEHVQVLHPDDLPRLVEMDVIASMQPIHATSDMFAAERYWGDRARLSYAWQSLAESGAKLVFGSDAPVERIDPLPGIHAAVTRQRADGSPGPDGWMPQEKISVEQAVRGFTLAAAETAGQDHNLGTTTAGKLADFTILDRDIFERPPSELLETNIEGTVVGGIFRHREF